MKRIVVLLIVLLATPAHAHESGVKHVRCRATSFNASTWRGSCRFFGFDGKDVRLVLRVKARWDVVLPDGHRSATTQRKVRTCLCVPPPPREKGGGRLPMPPKPVLTEEEIAMGAYAYPYAVRARVIHAHEKG